MQHFYTNQPDAAFYSKGSKITEINNGNIIYSDIFKPKFKLNKNDRTLSVGSCFAEHITNWVAQKFRAGELNEPQQTHRFSNLTCGNVYTTTQFLQILRWAAGEQPPELIWNGKDGLVDPFFQTEAFLTSQALLEKREQLIESAKQSFIDSSHLILTLGLTEQWLANGLSVIAAPGTVFPLTKLPSCEFQNLTTEQVEHDLIQCIKFLREIFEIDKITLTLSPVPLTATATEMHILTANARSKSILRAAIESITSVNNNIAYFPSYEIITNHRYSRDFFEPNMRQVNKIGVDLVMANFFNSMGFSFSSLEYSGTGLDDKCLEVFLENNGERDQDNDKLISKSVPFNDTILFSLGNSHITKITQYLKVNDNKTCVIASGLFWRNLAWRQNQFAIENQKVEVSELAQVNKFIASIPDNSPIIFGDFLATHYELFFFRLVLSKELHKLGITEEANLEELTEKLESEKHTQVSFLIKPWKAKINFFRHLRESKNCELRTFNTPYCDYFIDHKFGRQYYQAQDIIYSEAFFKYTKELIETEFLRFAKISLSNEELVKFVGKLNPFVSLEEQISFLSESNFDYIHGNEKYYMTLASKVRAELASKPSDKVSK